MKDNPALYLKNIIFGMSDSLVSTIGLLSGIDVSGTSRQVIIATGIIYAFVAAFSMAVGSFLSEQSAEEYKAKSEVGRGDAVTSAIVIFVSFVVASFIPLLPYLLFGLTTALVFSIIFSVVTLFIVGLISAKLSHVSMFSRAITMATLGGCAIVIGVLVGKFLKF